MLDGRQIRLDTASQRDRPQGGFGGQGGARGPPRSTSVNLTQDDKNAKKGSIAQFQGKLMALWELAWFSCILSYYEFLRHINNCL